MNPQITETAPGGVARDPETYAIIGAAMEVHRTLGPGFLEPVYQTALAVQFGMRHVPYEREVSLPVEYKGIGLGLTYRPDFTCYGTILVELKALRQVSTSEDAQVINYLVAGRLERGLLLNFGAATLQVRRFINSCSVSAVESAKSADVPVQSGDAG